MPGGSRIRRWILECLFSIARLYPKGRRVAFLGKVSELYLVLSGFLICYQLSIRVAGLPTHQLTDSNLPTREQIQSICQHVSKSKYFELYPFANMSANPVHLPTYQQIKIFLNIPICQHVSKSNPFANMLANQNIRKYSHLPTCQQIKSICQHVSKSKYSEIFPFANMSANGIKILSNPFADMSANQIHYTHLPTCQQTE